MNLSNRLTAEEVRELAEAGQVEFEPFGNHPCFFAVIGNDLYRAIFDKERYERQQMNQNNSIIREPVFDYRLLKRARYKESVEGCD